MNIIEAIEIKPFIKGVSFENKKDNLISAFEGRKFQKLYESLFKHLCCFLRFLNWNEEMTKLLIRITVIGQELFIARKRVIRFKRTSR